MDNEEIASRFNRMASLMEVRGEDTFRIRSYRMAAEAIETWPTPMQEIAAHTEGKMRIGPTTLYRSIKHMLLDGLIVEADERPDPTLDDERRRYYKLTGFGQQVTLAETRRLEQALSVARSRPLLTGSRSVVSSGGAE